MTTILLLISTVIFTSYVAFIWLKFGMLSSISDSYYYLKRENRFIFTLAMFGAGLPVTIQSETGMMFFAGAFICLVGAAPAFRGDFTSKIHSIGAIGGITLAMVSLWIDYGHWYISVGFAVMTFLLMFFRIKYHTWWIEILAFVCVVGVLFI